ncbi:MAG: hypothetical protein WD342_17935 [Verrucomicrobiales bacterium]
MVPGLLLIALWILPVTYVGFTNRPVPMTGRYLNHMWRISCLFPRRSNTWADYFYQVRTEGGVDWLEVPHEHLGEMRPFGAGNRLHRIMAQGGGDRNREAVLKSAAWFVKRQYELRHPDEPVVVEVRFVRRRYPVGSPALVATGGPWVIPELSEIPESRRTVWRQYRFEDRDAAEEERSREPKP